jgi:hypothetical protein
VLVRDAISGVMNYHLDEATRIGVVPLPASAVVAALA